MSEKQVKQLFIAFGISLVVNALCIGVILGNIIFHRPPMPPEPPKGLFTFEEMQQHHEIMGQARASLEKELLKEPYSKEGVINEFEKFDEKMNLMRDLLHIRIAEMAEKLAPKDRLKLLPPPPRSEN